MARATYYYHLKQTEKPDKYEETKRRIRTIYEINKGRIGHRRITLVLQKEQLLINHKTVLKLMRQLGLFCRVRMRRYHSYRGEVGKVAPDLLGRNFEADQPNQKWVTDVTEFSLFGQKLYLSPIIDLYSRDIVSYTICEHPRFSLVMDMLEEALRELPIVTNLILHSDQGWQYQQKPYQRMLAEKVFGRA